MAILSFLLSHEAATKRAMERKPNFVVHVETCGNISVLDRFVELDAEDLENAHNIARAWVHDMGNASAAIRRVYPDGTLDKPSGIIS